jgi:hypothetical protein
MQFEAFLQEYEETKEWDLVMEREGEEERMEMLRDMQYVLSELVKVLATELAMTLEIYVSAIAKRFAMMGGGVQRKGQLATMMNGLERWKGTSGIGDGEEKGDHGGACGMAVGSGGTAEGLEVGGRERVGVCCISNIGGMDVWTEAVGDNVTVDL